jgi:hypothetical protein
VEQLKHADAVLDRPARAGRQQRELVHVSGGAGCGAPRRPPRSLRAHCKTLVGASRCSQRPCRNTAAGLCTRSWMNDGTKIAVPSNPRLNTPYSHWGTAKPSTSTELAAVAIKSLRSADRLPARNRCRQKLAP